VLALVYFVWLDGRSLRLALVVTALFAAGMLASLPLLTVAPAVANVMPWAAMGASILVVRRFKGQEP